MNPMRRTLLQHGAAAGAFSLALSAGLLKPGQVLAAGWNKAAFEAKGVADALKSLDAATAAESREVVIKMPEIAENGAVVPIEVTSNLPDTESIAILVEKNPSPLNSVFQVMNGMTGYISTRIKMGQTSMVRVVVRAGGKAHVTAKEVKVTVGGCGG